MQGSSLDRLVLERWIRSGIDIAADRLDKCRFMLLPMFVLFGKLPCAIAFAVLPASVSPAGNLGSRSRSAEDSDETGFSHRLSFDHNVVDDSHVERGRSSLVESSPLDSGCNADLACMVFGRDGMAGGGNKMIGVRKMLASSVFIVFASLGSAPLMATSTPSKVVDSEIHSTNFAHSKIDTNPIRKLAVYLPAGYDESPRRYPVIYFFPDAFASYRNPFDHKDARGVFDRAIAAGMIDKFILVAVDMDTSLGSSWCVNSPVTGNWEDFVVEELTPYVDGNFKSLPRRESRGIAGEFMGGYCAIRLAMRHPDVFSSVYGLHPVGTGSGLKVMLSLPNWDLMANAKSLDDVRKDGYSTIFTTIFQAHLPNPEKPPLFIDLAAHKVGDQLVIDTKLCERVRANFFLESMIPQYAENLKSLRGFKFDWGRSDLNQDHVYANQAFTHKLNEFGIAHEAEEYNGTWGDKTWGDDGRIYSEVLPFFQKHLVFDMSTGNGRRSMTQ